MKNILCIIILSFLFSYAYSNHNVGPLVHDQLIQRYLDDNVDPVCKKSKQDFNEIKFCLEKYFLFYGSVIQPSIISVFSIGLSDSGDQIISINLSDSFSSDKYYRGGNSDASFEATIKTNYDDLRKIISKGIHATTEYTDEYEYCGVRATCFYSYTHLGTTDNGVIILEYLDYGGGSGVFPEFLGLKVKERMGDYFDYEENPSLTFDRQQIVLEKLFSLGFPSYISKKYIKINGNFIILDDGTKIEIPSHE